MLRNSNRAVGGQRMSLPLSKLKTEPDTFQFRAFECDEDHVRNLSNALGIEQFFDPMKVWKRGENDFVVLDGHHRYAAYRVREVKVPVPVIVYECEEAEACLLALRENSKAKLPMTKTERTDAAWRLVCSDYGLSKMKTAKATGVSTRTIANMRKTRKLLVERGEDMPGSWWQAMQLIKQADAVEWDDDRKEQMIEARANKLDDEIGKALGHMGHIQWEAVARVLERRIKKEKLEYIVDELGCMMKAGDDDLNDFPF